MSTHNSQMDFEIILKNPTPHASCHPKSNTRKWPNIFFDFLDVLLYTRRRVLKFKRIQRLSMVLRALQMLRLDDKVEDTWNRFLATNKTGANESLFFFWSHEKKKDGQRARMAPRRSTGTQNCSMPRSRTLNWQRQSKSGRDTQLAKHLLHPCQLSEHMFVRGTVNAFVSSHRS